MCCIQIILELITFRISFILFILKFIYIKIFNSQAICIFKYLILKIILISEYEKYNNEI